MANVTKRVDGPGADGSQDGRGDRRHSRKLADVFGDVLPETTSDERAADTGHETDSDSWYRENRPPHHE